VDLTQPCLNSIIHGREAYERYLKAQNNTSSKDVWRVYDHIADDIFHELYGQALRNVSKDMEEYIEKVIVDEFQIGA
jgi:ERCC4-related helicase